MTAGLRGALLLAVAACAGCGGGDRRGLTGPTTAGALTLRLVTAHFRLCTDAAPDSTLQEVAGAFEEAWYAFVRERCLS